MTKMILSFLTLMVIGTAANAGLLIDPYYSHIISGSSTTAGTVTGNDLGIRLGFNNLGFGLGVDATLAGTYKYENNGASSDFKPLHTGVFVSYAFPVLVRAYGTYFINSKVSDSNSSVTGNGTKIGVQFTGLPFIAIGLEVYTMNYTEQEIFGVKSSASGSETQTRLALSVPFYL